MKIILVNDCAAEFCYKKKNKKGILCRQHQKEVDAGNKSLVLMGGETFAQWEERRKKVDNEITFSKKQLTCQKL